MTFNMPGKHNAKIVKITCSGVATLSKRNQDYNTLAFDTIDGDTGHGVTINSSTYEITLSANKHYYGLGFFAVATTNTTSAVYYSIIATDTADNILNADDGFFAYDLGYASDSFGDSVVPPGSSTARGAYTLSRNSSTNMLFKIFKNTDNNTFSFKIKGGSYWSTSSSQASKLVNIKNDGTQLVLLEMS